MKSINLYRLLILGIVLNVIFSFSLSVNLSEKERLESELLELRQTSKLLEVKLSSNIFN